MRARHRGVCGRGGIHRFCGPWCAAPRRIRAVCAARRRISRVVQTLWVVDFATGVGCRGSDVLIFVGVGSSRTCDCGGRGPDLPLYGVDGRCLNPTTRDSGWVVVALIAETVVCGVLRNASGDVRRIFTVGAERCVRSGCI
jgi:hypothetical protein